METKIFHGNLIPNEVGRALVAEFNRGNLRAQKIGTDQQVVVQIASDRTARAGGATALTVTVQAHEDGVAVQVGRQDWMGVAASLGKTAFTALRNPFQLLGRLDDIAQDLESLQLTERVWATVHNLARTKNVSFQVSARLRRLTCPYCDTANEVGAPQCVACGAPLGAQQPRTCPHCGFVVTTQDSQCPNCHQRLP